MQLNKKHTIILIEGVNALKMNRIKFVVMQQHSAERELVTRYLHVWIKRGPFKFD